MINKFQQGGQALGSILALIQLLPEDLLKQILQAFSQWAQQKGINIQQLQLDPNALEQALGLFMQEMQQSAKHGAKLNYIKSLKHQCAEDEELYYFKKGGSLGCGCRKKEDGGEVTKASKGCSAIKKFKASYGAKFPESKKPNPNASKVELKFLKDRDKYRLKKQKEEEAYRKQIEEYNREYEGDRDADVGKEYPISERGKKPVIKKSCGSKLKKHLNGGSLNRIPFIKAGLKKVEFSLLQN